MYALYVKSDHRFLGDISDDELKFLVDNLEEESLNDTDYDLSRLTLEYLRGNGLSQRLAAVLDGALGDPQERNRSFFEPWAGSERTCSRDIALNQDKPSAMCG